MIPITRPENHITEAEWQIMRVIWSKAPTTSGYIAEELRDCTGWSPTTIKTLLGRLVKKNILGFEARNKTYYYYPFLTEEECIRNELRLLIGRIYGGALRGETQHFQFYGSPLTDYIESLSDTLESNFERLADGLRYQAADKTVVYIHSSLPRLHSALGVLKGPEWLRAGWTWGILHIVSPEYFTDIPADKVAVHALAEIMIHKINPHAPFWLHQGVAAYEGQWLEKERIRPVVAAALSAGGPPSFSSLSSDFRTFGDSLGHVYAYTAADYIIQTFGYEKLRPFLRAPNDFSGIFGMGEAGFWENWIRFLHQNYTD